MQVTVAEVIKNLKNLSRKKATGPGNLPPGILKDVAVIIAKPLCHIINISMKNGIIPSAFKLGKITPIYKSGSKHEMDNYRPITGLFKNPGKIYPQSASHVPRGSETTFKQTVWIP